MNCTKSSSRVALAFLLVNLIRLWQESLGSPYTISDDRVRSLDITPTLGRGYSIMTNSFQSTCLDVKGTTVPSYNYDYTFHDFTRTTNLQQDMSSSMSYSFGFWWWNAQASSSSSSSSSVSTNTRRLFAVMRIERYYASVREELSPLNGPAAELLRLQDYVGFFKACGPNYVRGIRRAQEVTAMFSFESASVETASQYASNVQVNSGWWYSGGRNFQSKSKFNAVNSSLQIKIVGFGMGLGEQGSETMIATSLNDFNNVMKFAFNSMTKGENSIHIGMVYGMEVVPWVYNTQFQIESQLHEEVIEIPLARSLIPRAYHQDDPTNINFTNTAEDRTNFRCKEISYQIDKFGYCCEIEQLYSYDSGEYVEEELAADTTETRVCRPLRSLDKAIVKDNMANNGEFVARLDRAVRYRMNQLSTLEKCVSAARAIPERFDFHILKPQDTVKYDGTISLLFSALELKLAVDPFSDYSIVRHLGRELDEYLDMFIQPCMAAIFGTHIGTTSETDAAYFMAYPWHAHDECIKLSCLGNSMRWDRSGTGGCVPGILAGPDSANYDNDNEENCQKDPNSGFNTCKYNSTELNEFRTAATSGWGSTLPTGRIDYFMDHFCLPQVTEDTLTAEEQISLETAYRRDLAVDKTMNVARYKTAVQSSTIHRGYANRAVDGNTNGRYRNNSVTHTLVSTDPWWYVDLQGTFTIERIVVYNRTDCCSERLSDFKLTIYDSSGSSAWDYPYSGAPGSRTTITVPDIAGARVEIKLLGADKILSLAEVEVWNRFS